MSGKYTPGILGFIKERYGAHSYGELRDMVNARFGTGFTYDQIAHIAYNNGLRKFIPPPLYTEIVNSKGYVKIKISMTGPQAGMWKEKHLFVWEQAHGKIPEGTIIIFLDGNRLNCALENLAAVSHAESVKLTQFGLRSNDREVTLAGIAVVRHLLAAHKRLEERLGAKTYKLLINRISRKRKSAEEGGGTFSPLESIQAALGRREAGP